MADANVTIEELLLKVSALEESIDGGAQQSDADIIWVLLAGFLVFFMHAGFTMLEAGSVQHKNAVNIMFKNLGTIAIGSMAYYFLGYGFAYGGDNAGEGSGKFIGSGNYMLLDEPEDSSNRHTFFFQFAFAATSATIVSGAVAGRINLTSYFLTALLMTAFTYPVVSHWVWDAQDGSGGFLSAFIAQEYRLFEGCGMLDFAGSGVVHLTGGVAAFWGAKILGPRLGRFDADGNPNSAIGPHSISLQTLGVFILWFGWYGFNCGSTLAFAGPVAAKVAVTTTLSAGAAVSTTIIAGRFLKGYYDIGYALNGALAGLVSITAGCPSVQDYSAVVIGIIGGLVYIGSSQMMLKLKIDDPVDAVAVHGFCGIWGCIATGIFGSDTFIEPAYGFTCDRGTQVGTQIVGVLCIIAWVTLIMLPFFLALKSAGILRVPAEFEARGLDNSEHGGIKFTSTGEDHIPTAKATETTDSAAKEEEVNEVSKV